MTQALDKTGNALEALTSVLDSYRRTFERMEDPYFRERAPTSPTWASV